jgi:hypothetical protein
VGAVEFDHFVIEGALFFGFHAGDGGTNFVVDVGDSFEGAFAEVARLIAIAKFHGFVFAGGRTGGNSGAADSAVGQIDIGFDGGVAARVKDLASNYFYYFHIILLWRIAGGYLLLEDAEVVGGLLG